MRPEPISPRLDERRALSISGSFDCPAGRLVNGYQIISVDRFPGDAVGLGFDRKAVRGRLLLCRD